MRISTNMMSRQFLTNLNKVYGNMLKYHRQTTTGRAFHRASEDPINAVKSMDLSSGLDRINLYQSNIDQAQLILREQEVGISSISDALLSVQTVVQQSLNTTFDDEDRKNMAQVVEATRENVIALLNKDFGGKFIYGGHNTSSNPMTVEHQVASYNGIPIDEMTIEEFENFSQEEMFYNTGRGTKVDVATSALDILGYGDENMLKLLDDISQLLREPSETFNEDMNVYLGKTNDHFRNLQAVRTTVGSRIANMDAMKAQLTEHSHNMQDLLSVARDVDIEEAIINFKTAEMVYQAALSAGASIIQPTLVDFLR
jgi:flagellar hook-associated protein 3 FlgL